MAAIVVLALAAFAITFTRVWNADIFWQLASGRWMLQYGRVLNFDPFSIDPQPGWINVHWLFQLIIAGLHSIGGFAILSGLKAALAVAMMSIFTLALRRRVPPAWLIFCGLAMLALVAGRLRVRPEAFTLAFLMLTIVLLERVRHGGSPNRLWYLAAVMLAWVNMHGLYILGLGLIWSSVVGTWIDRRFKHTAASGGLLTGPALAPILAATVAVLVSPWPLEAALHPILLWSRISGQMLAGEAYYYTYGVAEFQPTWEVLGANLHVIAIVLLAAVVMIANRRRLPTCHIIWFLAFLALAAMARRNIALLGPVVGYLLAWHGAAVLKHVGQSRPKLRRPGPYLAACMAAVALAVAAAAATSRIWRHAGSRQRFGPGLQGEKYPLAAAKFLAELPAKGGLLCENFGDSGAFIYHSYPRRKVYMDGRLEVHSLQRFIDQYEIITAMRTRASADTVELPKAVRFVFVRHDSRQRLTALAQSRRFQLIFLDRAGACFLRRDWYLDAPLRAEPNFGDLDRPLGRDGLLADLPAEKRRWYAQNPPPLNYQIGAMLLSLGKQSHGGRLRNEDPVQQRCILLAIRYLTAAQTENLISADVLAATLAQAHQQRALQCDVVPSALVPTDMNSTRALALYRQLDLTVLDSMDTRMFAVQRILALQQARQLDAAAQAVKQFLAHLPPRQRVQPPREYLQLRDFIQRALEASRAKQAQLEAESLSIPQRVDRLTSPQIGLIQQAIAELRLARLQDPQIKLRLGDLLLRSGAAVEAREVYAGVSLEPANAWQLTLRKALCDWAAGELFTAAEAMRKLAETTGEPLVGYYLAVLLEQLGRYEEANGAIAQTVATDAALRALIERIRRRLPKN